MVAAVRENREMSRKKKIGQGKTGDFCSGVKWPPCITISFGEIMFAAAKKVVSRKCVRKFKIHRLHTLLPFFRSASLIFRFFYSNFMNNFL